MQKSLQKCNFVKDDEAKRLEEQLNKEKLERKIAAEVKIEEAKHKKILEHETEIAEGQAKEEREKEIKVKLFKVEITKLSGTHLSWILFWIQYEAEIDKSKLSVVAKVFIFKRACNIESESFEISVTVYNRWLQQSKKILSIKNLVRHPKFQSHTDKA